MVRHIRVPTCPETYEEGLANTAVIYAQDSVALGCVWQINAFGFTPGASCSSTSMAKIEAHFGGCGGAITCQWQHLRGTTAVPLISTVQAAFSLPPQISKHPMSTPFREICPEMRHTFDESLPTLYRMFFFFARHVLFCTVWGIWCFYKIKNSDEKRESSTTWQGRS